jgi:hypothetical protein
MGSATGTCLEKWGKKCGGVDATYLCDFQVSIRLLSGPVYAALRAAPEV